VGGEPYVTPSGIIITGRLSEDTISLKIHNMRRIKVSMHVSLDGFVAGPNGEMNWIKIDDTIFDLVKTFTDNADTALFGRITWKMMEDYWPTAANTPNATRHDKEHSVWYNSTDIIVISNTMKGQSAAGITFLGGDIIRQIVELKRKSGKDILIFGSPSVVHALMKENLIDDYWLFVNPVILGRGISMFPRLDSPLALVHQATLDFACGVTALHFTNG
jgi:dihydrofolate reductase